MHSLTRSIDLAFPKKSMPKRAREELQAGHGEPEFAELYTTLLRRENCQLSPSIIGASYPAFFLLPDSLLEHFIPDLLRHVVEFKDCGALNSIVNRLLKCRCGGCVPFMAKCNFNANQISTIISVMEWSLLELEDLYLYKKLPNKIEALCDSLTM